MKDYLKLFTSSGSFIWRSRSQKETFCYLVDKKRGCQQGKQRRCQKTWQWVENCAKYIKPEKCTYYDPASAQKVLKKYRW